MPVLFEDRLVRILRAGATDDGGASASASRAAEVKVVATKSASRSAGGSLSSWSSTQRTAPTRMAGYMRLNRRISMLACLAESSLRKQTTMAFDCFGTRLMARRLGMSECLAATTSAPCT